MKQTILILLCAASIAVFFSSCKKNRPPEEEAPAAAVPNITAWFSDQQKGRSAETSKKIGEVQASLDLANAWTEQTGTKQLLIVPLRESLKLVNNKNNKVSNYLLLNTNPQTGKIGSGLIVQAASLDKTRTPELKKGTLKNIQEGRKVENDCILTVLTINDQFLYQGSYKNGSLNASAIMHKGKKPGDATTAVPTAGTECTDWYFVTTTYYSDGTIDEDWQFIGQTCTEGCSMGDQMGQTTVCDHLPEGETGGGGTSVYADFANYMQSSISSESVSPQVSYESPTPNTGSFTWTVVKGAVASWEVQAETQYSFLKTRYYLVNNGVFAYYFNITNYQTVSSTYIGSNFLVETTWTQTAVLDQIINNNSQSAKGKSKVSGVLHHRLRNPVPGLNTFLDTIVPVENEAVFTPV